MINLPLYEDWKSLNEIGEGVSPLPWKRVGVTKVDSWMSTLSMVNRPESINGKWEQLPTLLYEFKSDKATYVVRISGGWSKRLNIFNMKRD